MVNISRSNDKKNLVAKILRYMRPFWKGLAIVAVFVAFQSSISAFIPYLSKPLIDAGYAKRDVRTIIVVALIGGIMFIVTTFASFIQRYIADNIKKNIMLKMGQDYSRALYELPLDSFRTKSSGERAYLLTADLENISELLISRLPQALGVIFKIALYFCITFSLNKVFSIAIFVFTPPLIVASKFFRRVNQNNYMGLMKISQKMSQRIHESFSKIYLVKTFGAEEYEKTRYMELLKRKLELNLKSVKFNFLSGFAGSVFNKMAMGMVGIFGIFFVTKNIMTLGDVSAFLVYYGLFLSTISQALNFYERFAIDKIHLENFFASIESERKIKDTPAAIYMPRLAGAIAFKNVNFGYGQENKILSDFNIRIEPGIWSAIIGPSGCGKTTILNLIMRLYEIESGEITIDGMRLRDLKIRSLRENITTSTQDVLFFTDTIRNNILYGLDAAKKSDMELEMALEIACVDDFVSGLPLGTDTVLGDNAFNISQGEKQRLAIARALVRGPNILILDEALSSVSVELEAKIYGNIRSLRKNLTTIIVSHRPGTVSQADTIYRMDFGGRITVEPKAEENNRILVDK